MQNGGVGPMGRRSGAGAWGCAALRDAIGPAVLVAAAFGALGGAGCAGAFPVEEGNVLTIARGDRPVVCCDERYETTLQVRWIGTACHVIQLGDAVVVTDPFVTHHGFLHSLLGGTLASDEAKVHAAFEGSPAPGAVFVAHSHWDHLLDVAAALRLPGWEDTVLFGGETTGNLVAGWGEEISDRFRRVSTDPDGFHLAWESAGGDSRVEYLAIPATHAPQFAGLLLYDGEVTEPRTTPPNSAGDFQVGETFAYVFRLTTRATSGAPVQATVFFMSSASDWPRGRPPGHTLPVDAAILCVPSWKSADGYPQRILRAVRARHVFLSHYDDFFETDPEVRSTVPLSDVQGFLRAAQEATRYRRFRRIVVPDVGALVTIGL